MDRELAQKVLQAVNDRVEYPAEIAETNDGECVVWIETKQGGVPIFAPEQAEWAINRAIEWETNEYDW